MGPSIRIIVIFLSSFLAPRPTGGPIKLPFSVCPSVSSAFFSGMAHLFFMIFGTMADDCNI